MKKIVIYHNYIPKVGGIESAIYNLASGLDKNGYDVTILYNGAESCESLFHYAKVANVIKLGEEELEFDVCLIASNHIIPNRIKAKRFLQWVHSDYDRYKLDLVNKGKVEYIAVSKHCAKIIKKREGVECKVIYNLLAEDFGKDKRKVLRLVTNSRVSPEKGFGRMLELAKVLKEKGVRFSWVIYGDNSHFPKEYWGWIDKFRPIEEIQWVGYKSDILIGLTNADYLVQLSDFEGCPLAILEALKMEVPCIVTNWGGVEELIEDGINGYVLPMDTKLYGGYVDKIVNNIPRFKYEAKSEVEDWIKIIDKENGK